MEISKEAQVTAAVGFKISRAINDLSKAVQVPEWERIGLWAWRVALLLTLARIAYRA